MRRIWLLKRAEFRSVNLNKTAFQNAIDFSGTRFEGVVYLSGSRFNQTAHFSDAQFNQIADFSEAHFNQTAHFSEAKINQDADFRRAQFNQYADFSGAQFNQELYLEDARFFNASFNSCQFSKGAFFQGAQINGTLSLYRTKYDTLNIRWSSIHDLAYDDTAYHLLIQNFNKLGFGDDARECQYSYRCERRAYLWDHDFGRWIFDFLAFATYGYGLRPVWPLGWSVAFILMGGLFFFLTNSVVRSKPPSEQTEISGNRIIAEKVVGKVSIWEAFLLSATYFTSGASSIISATPTEFVPLGRGRYVVVILRLLGWIFFVLFLSSLTRTV